MLLIIFSFLYQIKAKCLRLFFIKYIFFLILYKGNRNGQIFNHCYYFLRDGYAFADAVEDCRDYLNTSIVQPKKKTGLDDLYPLYKSHDNFYFWVSL